MTQKEIEDKLEELAKKHQMQVLVNEGLKLRISKAEAKIDSLIALNADEEPTQEEPPKADTEKTNENDTEEADF